MNACRCILYICLVESRHASHSSFISIPFRLINWFDDDSTILITLCQKCLPYTHTQKTLIVSVDFYIRVWRFGSSAFITEKVSSFRYERKK